MSHFTLDTQSGLFEVGPAVRKEEQQPSRGVIVTFASTLAFADPEQVAKIFGYTDINTFDDGRQAHYLTRRGQSYLVNLPMDHLTPETLHVCKTESDTNAKLWENQLGIHLASQENVIIATTANDAQDASYVNLSSTYIDTVRYFHKMGYTIATPTLNGTFLRAIGIDTEGDSTIARIAVSHDTLDTKGKAEQVLRTSIPMPQTMTYDHTVDTAQILSQLTALSTAKKYIFKPSSSAGGFGIMMGDEGNGYTVQELRNLITQDKLQFSGVIQEYIEGDDYGAVGVFDANGNFQRVRCIHKQRVDHGHFIGVEWDIETQEQFSDQVHNIFQALNGLDGLHLAGDIGIDFRGDPNGIVKGVYEINPRVTGASPIGILLQMLTKREDIAPVHQAILNIGVPTSSNMLLQNKLIPAVENVRSEHLNALILPQGIRADGKSKFMFAAGPRSDAKKVEEMFMSSIQ